MAKNVYSKPLMVAEKFTPQEFVAACANPTHWTATCRTVSCLIFDMDGDWSSDRNRGGCGQSHTFELQNGLKPEANCWLLLNVRTRMPGQTTVNSYPYNTWFSKTGNYEGSGYVIKEDMVEKLKAAGELVLGYYNDKCFDGRVLVTDDIANIKNPS